MPEPDLEKILAARARVGAARGLLAHPLTCSLDECVTLLREAHGYLEWLRDSLTAAGPSRHALRRQAIALSGEIGQTGILLEQARRYGRRWLERLQAGAGYTALGGPLPIQPRGRISIFG